MPETTPQRPSKDKAHEPEAKATEGEVAAKPTPPPVERGGTERKDARPYATQWLKIHLPTHSTADVDSLTSLLDAYAKEA
jgi:hypothetical protein